MMLRTFIDTNVFIYAEDADAGDKREIAQKRIRELIEGESAVVSTQVLQEYFAIATRKLKLDPVQAREGVEALTQLEVMLIDPPLVLAAIDLHRLHGLSFWDALVVKCAANAECAVLLSEDLQHGRTIEGVRIENPFR